MKKGNVCTALSRLKNFSLLGLIRLLHLKLSGKEVIVTGKCRMCGRCCRRISLEAGGRWLRREADFEKVVRKYPEYERFTIVGRDRQGFLLFTCSWYSEEEVCADHENRLSICRKFPEKQLYFTGGEVPEGCGYRFREIVPFAVILDEQLEEKNEGEKKSTCN